MHAAIVNFHSSIYKSNAIKTKDFINNCKKITNDKATFFITLEGLGDSPNEARENLQEQSEKLDSMLSSFGGTEKTRTISIVSEPIWRHLQNKSPTITGYSMKTTTYTECSSDVAGILAAKLLEINPHQLRCPNFEVSEKVRKDIEIELLKEAAINAKEKASAIASAAELKVGDILYVTTEANWGHYEIPMVANSMKMDSLGSSQPVPMQSGESKINASVNGRFELLPQNQ